MWLVLKRSGLILIKKEKDRRINTMKTKKIKNHIRVQSLRNSEMRAARGGEIYTCGDSSTDSCKKLRVVVSAIDLLSIYATTDNAAEAQADISAY
jgi:hypothetical protein